MITCCKDCQDRAINCHSTCDKYIREVERHSMEQEKKRKFNEGYVAVVEYKRDHYKTIDRRNHNRELRGRRKW